MVWLYHFFRFLFLGGVGIAAIRNEKAKKWIWGRKYWEKTLKQDWKITPGEKVIWMHCASAGEFEQGRPLLESIKKSNPGVRLILTFFSPSGYEMHKDYKEVSKVMYLPFDGSKNAKQFIEIIQPCLAIFVKYEFWYFYLTTLKKHQIPTLLVSGIFRPKQPFFQWWGGFHRKMLDCFTFFFLQDTASMQLLESIGYKSNVMISGDTRFDRVAELAAHPINLPSVESFCMEKVLVAGSTWPKDDQLLQEWYLQQKGWKLLLVPHEIDNEYISDLQKRFPSAIRYSELSGNENLVSFSTLIIDTIGILSKIYRYATLCYIGGGFQKGGHHNILEAAVYGKAVVTGPHIEKFSESIALNQLSGSFLVQKSDDLLILTNDLKRIEEAGKKAGSYVNMNLGATKKIMEWIDASAVIKK